jgi:uncharacterized protein (TIGR02246 family)
MKKTLIIKSLFIIVLSLNAIIILFQFIYVTAEPEIHNYDFPQDRTEDLQEIQRLENINAEGWAEGNGAKMASVFTSDADYVTFNGEWLKGREEIAKVHQELFDGVLQGSSLANRNIRSIQFIADSIAMIHMTGAIRQKGKREPAKSRNSIQTLVAKKENNEWKFVAFHNARIKRISLWEGIMMSFN